MAELRATQDGASPAPNAFDANVCRVWKTCGRSTAGAISWPRIAEYVAGEQFNADCPESHLNLGLLYLARRQAGAPEGALRTALETARRSRRPPSTWRISIG